MIFKHNQRIANTALQYHMNNCNIENVYSFKLLGVWLDCNAKWTTNINDTTIKCSRKIYLIVLLKRAGCQDALLWKVFAAFVKCHLTYCYPAWCNCSKNLMNKLIKIEKRFKIIIKSNPITSTKTTMDNIMTRIISDIRTSNEHPLRILFDTRNNHNMIRRSSNSIQTYARTSRRINSIIKFRI